MAKLLNVVQFNYNLLTTTNIKHDKTFTKLKHPNKIYSKRKLEVIDKIIIHHTASNQSDLSVYEKHHVEVNKWPAIGYHFVINRNGDISYYNNIDLATYHCKGHNNKSVGIALVGNFTVGRPDPKQIDSLNDLIAFFALYFHEVTIHGHNEFRNTLCPGKNFDIDDVKMYYLEMIANKRKYL